MSYRQVPNTLKIASTDVAQPMLGSWITAGPAAFTAGPCGAPITLTLGSELSSGNDASMFVAGEPAWLIDPAGSTPQNMETVRIQSKTGNTVTLGNQTDMSGAGGANPVTRFPHYVGAIGTGTFIMPKQLVNNFLIMFEDGGTGNFLYIGCSPAMTATAYRVFKLAKTATNTQPQWYASAMYSPGNPQDFAELFVYGTANDTYALSIEVT